MKEKTKVTLMIMGVLLLIVGTVSITYAMFSTGKTQEVANRFTSGCLNISIENESDAITLNNAYPITDVEGLQNNGYTFTIKNTCSTSTKYQINLESLNETTNTLNADYIKVSLSSDTMDNLISKLSSNTKVTPTIENAYEAYNLYTGEIAGNTTKEFTLKEWMDYDTTKEQGTSKTYTSKINVIANTDLEYTETPEIKTTLVDNTLEGTITGNVTTAKYCTSGENICTPSTNTAITNNTISIIKPKATTPKKEIIAVAFGNIEVNTGGSSIICTNLNNGKTYCSNSFEITVEPDFRQVATTDEGVYAAEDGMYGGISYYWRGAVESNYVKFAGFCWRIVRINGDKSIRLIYDGATCHANGTSTTDSIAITDQAYNTSFDRSEYVGYTYSVGAQRPTNNLEGTASNLKIQNDTWYNNNIGNNSTYSSKVTDGKFCNDRNIASGYSWSSQPASEFYYASYERDGFKDSNTGIPTLNCPSEDTYTLKAGAITMDEVSMAGSGKWGLENNSYYLYNGQEYWTMSPLFWYYMYYEGMDSPLKFSVVYYVTSIGELRSGSVKSDHDVRPVINLKSNITFSGGNGTLDNPYVVAD